MKDYKDLLIVFLILIIIGSFIFKKNNSDNSELLNKLNVLNEKNLKLNNKIDSLYKVNDVINITLIKLKEDIKIKKDSLDILNNKIKDFENGEGKVTDNVDDLDINEFDDALTKYLEER